MISRRILNYAAKVSVGELLFRVVGVLHFCKSYFIMLPMLTLSYFRLDIASQSYHHTLCKKAECEALDEPGKLLPVDALGVVMILHGEEFGEDSAFGSLIGQQYNMSDIANFM